MRILFILITSALLLVGCGHHEGIIQKADVSYIKFTGNLHNATVQIDDLSPFRLRLNSRIVHQLSPGKHIVKVTRSGNIVVNRILFLDNQTTTEIRIP